MKLKNIPNRLVICGILSWIMVQSVPACNVPTFRYALERWFPDPYDAIAEYPSNPAPKTAEAVSLLTNGYTNLRVRKVLGDKETEPNLKVYYSRSYGNPPPVLWSGPLSVDSAKKILASPVRREIARKILDGNTAVWIQLETGDPEVDDKVEKLLRSTLDQVEETTSLGYSFLMEYQDYMVSSNHVEKPNSNIPIKIDYATVRLSPDDKREKILIDLLTNMEEGLEEYADEPMLIPVFGRGRALYLLIGNGINPANIKMTCEYISGACACTIKYQNPGCDLLLTAPWDQEVNTAFATDEPPELSGVMPGDIVLTTNGAPSESNNPEIAENSTNQLEKPATEVKPDSKDNDLGKTILVVLGVLAGIIVLFSIPALFKQD